MEQKTRGQRKFVYSVHPSVQMVRHVVADLKNKTGRTLEEWIDLAKRRGPAGGKARADWLKSEHLLGTNYAGWISGLAEGKGMEELDPEAYLMAAEGYVEEMFAGPKAGLKPLYDSLLNLAFKLGKDVKAYPCRTIVPLYRKHVFAQLKPATRTRIDAGFALGDLKATGRLMDTGGFAKKDRITHRIPISAIEDIDDEVKRWFKAAYDKDV